MPCITELWKRPSGSHTLCGACQGGQGSRREVIKGSMGGRSALSMQGQGTAISKGKRV